MFLKKKDNDAFKIYFSNLQISSSNANIKCEILNINSIKIDYKSR